MARVYTGGMEKHVDIDADVEGALAERVRKLLMDSAAAAYEDARMSGLCGEGGWEIAYGALRDADLTPALKAHDTTH